MAQIEAGELLRQEIIGKAGLTPTDLMHVEGTYTPWNVEAASLAQEVFAHRQFQNTDELRQKVWQRITEMALYAIVTFLTGKRLAPAGAAAGAQDNDLGRWFFDNSLYNTHPHLETLFRLRQPIIGIGAPAGQFLKPVAEALHAELVLPEFHEVANAVGAIAGAVMVQEEILIYPRLDNAGLEVLGYYVQTSEERLEIEDLAEALAHATRISQERALGAALRSGADNPQVVVEQTTDGLDTYRVRAKAMGNPRLGTRD